MDTCCYITAKKTICRFKTMIIYNDKPLCKMHFGMIKATEECPICLQEMTDKKKRIELTNCGHYFHKACLAKCHKNTCPSCRTEISPIDNIDLYSDIIFRPFAELLFAHEKSIQASMIGSISNLFNILNTRGTETLSMMEWVIQILQSAFVEKMMPTEEVMNILSLISDSISS